MRKKTVFLLQDTNDDNDKLRKLFTEEGSMEVIGQSTDGVTAVAMVGEKKPDILICELVLSGYDGLSVINRIRSQKLNTKIVVLSALCRDEIVDKAIGLGADYFLAKPINFEILIERLKELLDPKPVRRVMGMMNNEDKELDEKLSSIFINVGIPPHIKGYNYLREGVKIAIRKPEVVNNITKQLYPMIGEKYSTSASKVERAIRHAIEVAWNRGRIDNINVILGVRAFVGKEKPTNGEFIALVADKLMLEIG